MKSQSPKAGKTHKARKVPRRDADDLELLPSIGPATARYLRRVGVSKPKQLVGKDPYELYKKLCRVDEKRYDPCLCDQFIAAVRFVNGGPARNWWTYSAERKKIMSQNKLRESKKRQ